MNNIKKSKIHAPDNKIQRASETQRPARLKNYISNGLVEESQRNLLDSQLIFFKATRTINSTYLITKHVFDLVMSSLILVMLSPALILIAILVKMNCKGTVIFKDLRIGRNGRPFYMYKFRTMKMKHEVKREASTDENIIPFVKKFNDDSRVTRVGTFLRNYKLDELPQFVNVLKGEMSIIGPRPYPIAETYTIPAKYNIRFEQGLD